jgi:hypothetical protein
MKNDEFDLENFVSRICRASTRKEVLLAYLSEFQAVQDLKFVVASPYGTVPGFAVNRDFANGAAVRSLFKSGKILFLDPETVFEELNVGKALVPFDYSISLDTQALSHLKPYVIGRTPEKIDPDLRAVFEFIARDDVFVDSTPYMSENLDNLQDGERAAEEIFSRLRAYEVLRTLDKDHFQTTGEARSTVSDAELNVRAQTTISSSLSDYFAIHGIIAPCPAKR